MIPEKRDVDNFGKGGLTMVIIKCILGVLNWRKAVPARAIDVAAYILASRGPMTAMKLEKLVYYSQAWSLVWDEKPIFPERIEAWAQGPVVPDLFNEHRGMFMVNALNKGNADVLTKDERETVDAVLHTYGAKTSQWLSDLTHQESPWLDARIGVSPGAFCDNEIPLANMAEFYSGLQPAQ